MVEKICKKIGAFVIYCLKLCGYEFNNVPIEKDEEAKEISRSLINEWLYGEEGGVKNE